MTHICVGKLAIIGSDNGLSPIRSQAITWTNASLLSIGLPRTYFSEIWIWILSFSFKKMQLKMSSAKWRPFCLSLNVLTLQCWYHIHRGSKPGHHCAYSWPGTVPCTISRYSAEWKVIPVLLATPQGGHSCTHSWLMALCYQACEGKLKATCLVLWTLKHVCVA